MNIVTTIVKYIPSRECPRSFLGSNTIFRSERFKICFVELGSVLGGLWVLGGLCDWQEDFSFMGCSYL